MHQLHKTITVAQIPGRLGRQSDSDHQSIFPDGDETVRSNPRAEREETMETWTLQSMRPTINRGIVGKFARDTTCMLHCIGR